MLFVKEFTIESHLKFGDNSSSVWLIQPWEREPETTIRYTNYDSALGCITPTCDHLNKILPTVQCDLSVIGDLQYKLFCSQAHLLIHTPTHCSGKTDTNKVTFISDKADMCTLYFALDMNDYNWPFCLKTVTGSSASRKMQIERNPKDAKCFIERLSE